MKTLRFAPLRPENTLILEIGCGPKRMYPASHSVTLDINPTHRPDVVHDLEIVPYPFADGQFGAIYCVHVLEHIGRYIPAIQELHRILEPNGELFVEAPYFSSVHAFADPTHVRFFTSRSFDYFVEGCGLTALNYAPIRFRSVELEIIVPGNGVIARLVRALIHRNLRRYEERWAFIFPRHTIRYRLRK